MKGKCFISLTQEDASAIATQNLALDEDEQDTRAVVGMEIAEDSDEEQDMPAVQAPPPVVQQAPPPVVQQAPPQVPQTPSTVKKVVKRKVAGKGDE